MIRVNPECYSCFLRQVETACKFGEFGEETTIEILRRASRYISTVEADQVPARVASTLHEMVRDTAGVFDPFEGVKREQKGRFDTLYRMAKGQVERGRDRLETALLLSGAGNIYDFGIISREEAEHYFPGEGSFRKGIFDVSSLRRVLRDVRVIGLVLDNTGEAPFDIVLAELLLEMGYQVWLGVKGGPVIDDITYTDAIDLGLEKRLPVISSQSQAVGTDLGDTSDEFRGMIDASDLIISKGQANFETLYPELGDAFFLFVCKCPVIERLTGEEFGNIMLLGGNTADEPDKNRRLSHLR